MSETTRVILRPVMAEDTDLLVTWRNNPLILDTVFDPRPVTREQHLAWYNSLQATDTRIEFIIQLATTRKPIGRIGLTNIDYRNQKAEYSISLGDANEWGKGYGEEASYLLLNFGFRQLNLHKIYLKVFAENQRAVKLYYKLGFQLEGTLHEEIFKNGHFHDLLYMSIYRKDYLQ